MKKILVLSASAGAGHLRAAEAIEKAYAQVPNVEVRNIDVLKYTNKAFRALYSKAYIELVNKAPEVLGWLYDHLDVPGKNEKVRLAFNKLNMRPFVRLLEEYRPDVAICTHFLPSELISHLKEEGRFAGKLAVVVTDFDVHAMWLCRRFEHFFVALEETKVHLRSLGMPSDKVTVSGIPIDPIFAVNKDVRELREKHGVRAGVPTILISAGGFGVGPIEHMISSLLRLEQEAQVLAVCGRSAELKTRIEQIVNAAPPGRITIKVLGFTTEMDELMTIADLLIGKPGGLTTSEALAKGLAFAIVNPIPGQEERNSDHLLEAGVGIRCNNLPTLAYKVGKLLADAPRLATMREHSRAMGRPDAAGLVAERSLGL